MNTVNRIFQLVIDYGISNLFYHWSIAEFLRMIRNSVLIIINGYSWILPALILVSLINLIQKKKLSLLILVVCCLVPFFLTTKFWYGGLYGRYSAFIGYCFAIMIALIPNRIYYWLTIISIIVLFIPTVIAYHHQPVPLIQRQIINKAAISRKDLIILSDYQRPQLTYPNGIYINGNTDNLKIIKQKINQSLKNKQKVFITQQAVTFPYWQYDGQQIHIISKGDKNKALLRKFLDTKNLKIIIRDPNYPLLTIYQILD